MPKVKNTKNTNMDDANVVVVPVVDDAPIVAPDAPVVDAPVVEEAVFTREMEIAANACPNCDGSGKSVEDDCSNCGGKGTV